MSAELKKVSDIEKLAKKKKELTREEQLIKNARRFHHNPALKQVKLQASYSELILLELEKLNKQLDANNKLLVKVLSNKTKK